jgi:hypothetical protein
VSVSLRGDLKDFGIADVFQLIGQQRKTGVLEFQGHGERIQFLFDRGAVVTAAPVGLWSHAALGEMLLRCGLLTRERVDDLRRECEASAQPLPSVAISRGWLEADELRQIEDLLTGETIFAVLRWQVGSFDFSASAVEHDREFDSLLGAEQILMDGLRMVDEWQSFAELVPSEDTVFRVVDGFAQYVERAGNEAERHRAAAERVFSLIDGRLAVRRIIDLSLLGTFDAVRALASLHRVRAIEAVDAEKLRSMQEDDRFESGRMPKASKLVAVAAPLLFLLVVAVSAQLSWNREPPAEFAIERPTQMESVRRVYELRRLRNALETFWFIQGRWPIELSELASVDLETGDFAPDKPHPYYFAHRADGTWVLGPDR